jgi:hypothetical protein
VRKKKQINHTWIWHSNGVMKPVHAPSGYGRDPRQMLGTYMYLPVQLPKYHVEQWRKKNENLNFVLLSC